MSLICSALCHEVPVALARQPVGGRQHPVCRRGNGGVGQSVLDRLAPSPRRPKPSRPKLVPPTSWKLSRRTVPCATSRDNRHAMKTLAALAISATMLFAQNERAAVHSVTAIRSWSLTEVTRIAIEVSGEFHTRSDRLHNPERVYFDIVGARPRLDAKRIWSKEIGDKLVQRVRVAETMPGTTRIVLDLAGPVEVTTSQLSNPNRLIVELRAGNGPPIPGEPMLPAVKPPPVISAEITKPNPSLTVGPQIGAATGYPLGRERLDPAPVKPKTDTPVRRAEANPPPVKPKTDAPVRRAEADPSPVTPRSAPPVVAKSAPPARSTPAKSAPAQPESK